MSRLYLSLVCLSICHLFIIYHCVYVCKIMVIFKRKTRILEGVRGCTGGIWRKRHGGICSGKGEWRKQYNLIKLINEYKTQLIAAFTFPIIVFSLLFHVFSSGPHYFFLSSNCDHSLYLFFTARVKFVSLSCPHTICCIAYV